MRLSISVYYSRKNAEKVCKNFVFAVSCPDLQSYSLAFQFILRPFGFTLRFEGSIL